MLNKVGGAVFLRGFVSPKEDRASRASGVMLVLYLLISSTSESAFANPIAVPMAFWLGFLLAERRNTHRECDA